MRLSRQNPDWSLRKLTSELVNNSLDSPSNPLAQRFTVSKRMLEFGLESHTQTEKQLLTDKDKTIRYDWCFEKKNWSFEKWSSCVFNDGSYFQLFNRKSTHLVRRF